MTRDVGIRPSPSFRRRPESRAQAHPELRKGRGVDSRFRGNDDEVGGFHMALAVYGDSPSPNPLPLGEGFTLVADVVPSQWPGFVMRGRGARSGAPTLYGSQRHMKPPNPIRPLGAGKPSPSGRGLGEGEALIYGNYIPNYTGLDICSLRV